ncbi:2-oxoglutarate-dependent dioxygenase [Rhodanobacter glycinis]|uniref:2-oxoglutarate-dependent dioxygenase n=1 Tax=Rhodanobacter glycinis TaxID=582702 RepID=A0A5B9E6R0_9GAMM|nr:2OG-Fe(II) oxygenase [Rhodanobacter glycinis]QEE25957.1 2-oxoglutarate-dependent dioxygenase [Rhodanobacter glycinis]
MRSHTLITPELRQWILETTRTGHSVTDVLRLMHETGYAAADSRRIVAAVLDMPPTALDSRIHPRRTHGVHVRLPDGPLTVVGERNVRVMLAAETPPLRVFDGLLSDDECAALIELAKPRLQRARTVAEDGAQQIDEHRTSDGMFFGLGEQPLIERIEARIAALLGTPVDHGEGLQVLHYLPGQQYEPHQDWFDPTQPGYAAITATGGQRIASLVIYLNTPDAGGGTAFPEIGLTVTALRGSAVCFTYESGDAASLHAGLPVTRGEKWIATKWLRERPYREPAGPR